MSEPEAVIKTSPTIDNPDPTQALKVEHGRSTPPLPSVVASDAAQDVGEQKPCSATLSKNAEYVVVQEEVSTRFASSQLPRAAGAEPSTIEEPETSSGNPLLEPRQHASSSSESHGIYLRSPTLMISCWIFGVIFSLCHHLFYSHFDGSIVGNSDEEQWNIRIGSFFALAVKVLLMASVWFAYTQWLWRTLKRKDISIRGLDAAFSVETSMIALLNPEMIFKMRTGMMLALIAWCLQIPPLITPATLFVVSSTSSVNLETDVLSLDITKNTEAYRFAYFTPLIRTYANANSKSYSFDGPRSILTRISTAAASFGQILPINHTYSDSFYSIQFLGPYVNCAAANSTVGDVINAFLQNMNATMKEDSLAFLDGYYAFVPSFDSDVSGSTTLLINGRNITAMDQPRLQQQPGNATNELWMKFYRYLTNADGHYILNANGNKIHQPMYLVCSLYNASYDLEFTFQNGVQSIQNKSITILNPVDYPINNPNEPSDLVQLSYSAVFWVLADQMVGSMGLNINSLTGAPVYSSIDTNIEHNSVLGSNDLDYFFDLNSEVYGLNSSVLSDQRLQDKALAQNQTLPFLTQQLFFNITMSLMNDPLLAPLVPANTTYTTPVNRYSYSVRNLWLSYGLANFSSLCAIILGMVAFINNQASHNNSFSTILSISRDAKLDNLFPDCCHGKLPLPKDTMKAHLRVAQMDDGGQSLQPRDNERSICKACVARAAAEAPPRPLGIRKFSTWNWRSPVLGAMNEEK